MVANDIYPDADIETMSDLLDKVVAISVGLLVAAILMPIALTTLADANTTGVNESVVIILTVLLPVLAVIGIAMYFLRRE